MMRSMFSAISGLRNHQLLMDTTGNNIANVNTTAFKGQRVTFQDIISQTMRNATQSTTNRAGFDPLQVGLGVQLSTIDTIMTQGSLQATGKPSDLAIQGDGFFVLSDNASSPAITFTRDGNFELGVAVNSGDPRPLVHAASGLHVKGYNPPKTSGDADSTDAPTTDITIPATLNSKTVTGFSVDVNGTIALSLSDGTTQANYAQVALATFQNSGGLNRIGNNMMAATSNSGTPQYNGAGIGARGTTNGGFLEMSNIDLATQFTEMIIAQRGFQANSRVITASDEVLQDLVNIKR